MPWTKNEIQAARNSLHAARGNYMGAVLRGDGNAKTFEAALRQELTSVVRSILEKLEKDAPLY
jgi:hypothetical protein